ncbi:hypothetical protein CYMTET_45469 [Cymbomonas tetramitiformis]|uniref:Phosphatidylinositol N-acetylglucosaminyltransferase subunit H conserved domain-containing protein n=1 Tax=Cymbomonas tetramitiformis TaxID=36881 RepID=A0AAE0EYL3_9CHLO|nr:hypothetical protein CYMTET_45469 [Cymbomonas tetramitiformis]
MELLCEPVAPNVVEFRVQRSTSSAYNLHKVFGLVAITVAVCKVWLANVDFIHVILGSGFLFGLLLLYWRRGVHSESVIVAPKYGIQLCTRFRSGVVKQHFIDVSTLQSCFINEAITTVNVEFYLAFLVEGENTLLLAYPTLRPRLELLKQVYGAVQSTVFQ